MDPDTGYEHLENYNNYTGGGFVDKLKPMVMVFFVATIILVILLITFIVLYVMEKVKIDFKSTSTNTASFTSGHNEHLNNFVKKQHMMGNHPQWANGSLDAGAGGPLDRGGRDLGWSTFKSNLVPRPQHRSNMVQPYRLSSMSNKDRYQVDNNDALAAASRAAQQQRVDTINADVSSNQAQVLSTCGDPWNNMATEEAKVLGSIGVYKQSTPGMAGFARTVNDKVTLTDAQLEAIMQGQEPFDPRFMPRVDAVLGNINNQMGNKL
jgi:hypothetical protein